LVSFLLQTPAGPDANRLSGVVVVPRRTTAGAASPATRACARDGIGTCFAVNPVARDVQGLWIFRLDSPILGLYRIGSHYV